MPQVVKPMAGDVSVFEDFLEALRHVPPFQRSPYAGCEHEVVYLFHLAFAMHCRTGPLRAAFSPLCGLPLPVGGEGLQGHVWQANLAAAPLRFRLDEMDFHRQVLLRIIILIPGCGDGLRFEPLECVAHLEFAALKVDIAPPEGERFSLPQTE